MRWPHSVFFWLLAALVIGFTQNALGLLMHEGSHYFFHHNKKASDLWCDALVCLPIFNTVQGYRTPHFEHHRCSGETTDPYFELYGEYPTRQHLIRCFLIDCSGISAIQKFFKRQVCAGSGKLGMNNPTYALPFFLLVQFLLWLLLFGVTGKWYAWLLLWVAPLMTVAICLNRLRTIVEHYPGFQGIQVNRTSLTGWLEYLCIAPYGYGHHLEHHWLPQVPYYDLAFTHRFLAERFDFASNDVNSHGYLHTFRRLVHEIGELEKSPRP
ncbi:fatty acid desaturase [Prosthecobacter sp.]|uniref:fatty acid desaturase n=1 Tax=Prosthecobacter sp. TaxID=1965333 RepID=UPI002488C24E|nr:fatty acid desaturase [Prosthecobacter sp.]MDI1315222.1 fatty acid desaturase [Prosthecobacter sp.]